MLLLTSAWRRDGLRTNLWFAPTLEVARAVVLYAITHAIDDSDWRGTAKVPVWLISSSPRRR